MATHDCENITCKNPWDENGSFYQADFLNHMYFWLEGVVQNVLAGIGLLGNIFAICVFSSKYLRSTFHTYLIALAFFDTGYICIAMFQEILQMNHIVNNGSAYPNPNGHPNPIWATLYPHLFHPFHGIFACASEFFTVIISIDRYIAIKFPFHYHINRETIPHPIFTISAYSTRKRSEVEIKSSRNDCVDIKRVLSYSSLALLLACLYCIPLFFEYDACDCNYTIKETNLLKSEEYKLIYYVIFDLIFRFFLPVSILTYTNWGIYNIIKKHVTMSCNVISARKTQDVMLIGVVGLLLTCNSFRFAVNIYNTSINNNLVCCGQMSAANQIAHMTGRVLITLNSSANCFIYLAASKSFRSIAIGYQKSISMFITKYCSKCKLSSESRWSFSKNAMPNKFTSMPNGSKREELELECLTITKTYSGSINVIVPQKKGVKTNIEPTINTE